MEKNAGLNSNDPLGQWNYFMEYKFIPDLVTAYLDGRCSFKILKDIDYWKSMFNSHYSDVCFRWEKFTCEERRIDDDSVLLVYCFPEPVEVPQAAYGAIFVCEKQKKAEYYTLEKSFENMWYIGAQNGDVHLNFGLMENPTLDSFVEWVIKHCARK